MEELDNEKKIGQTRKGELAIYWYRKREAESEEREKKERFNVTSDFNVILGVTITES